ncbi:MAG: hypothetical protein AAF908_10010 [Pseudomonadota bacterium]
MTAPQPRAPALATAVPAGGTAWSNASLAKVFTEYMTAAVPRVV